MKILTVYECQMSGGLDRLFIHLIKNWPDKSDQWQIYCHRINSGNELIVEQLKSHAQILFYGRKKGVPTNKIKRWLGLIYNFLHDYWYFKKQIKESRPDIVFLLQGGYPGAFSEQAAALTAKKRSKNIKVIMSIQSLPAMRDKKLFCKILDKYTNADVDLFIFASQYTVKEYLNKTNLDSNKFNIVPEGVEANLEDKVITNESEMVNIGTIGSYTRSKGREVLFKAAKNLIDQGVNNFKILSYGQKEFGEFDYHVELAKKIGVENYVEWKGFEKDLDRLFGTLDIVVQSSIGSESMPLVPLDAAAYYKPVIASKLQGLLDEIVHNETGYLFDVGDSEALAYYLKELIFDKKKREQMGENARKRYLENFTAEKMAKRYYEVFTK